MRFHHLLGSRIAARISIVLLGATLVAFPGFWESGACLGGCEVSTSVHGPDLVLSHVTGMGRSCCPGPERLSGPTCQQSVEYPIALLDSSANKAGQKVVRLGQSIAVLISDIGPTSGDIALKPFRGHPVRVGNARHTRIALSSFLC